MAIFATVEMLCLRNVAVHLFASEQGATLERNGAVLHFVFTTPEPLDRIFGNSDWRREAVHPLFSVLNVPLKIMSNSHNTPHDKQTLYH